MSKFEVLSGEQIIVDQYDLYCSDFDFHSPHYEGTCNGGHIVIDEGTSRRYEPYQIKLYVDPPAAGDLILLLGIPNTFIVDKVGTFGSLRLKVLGGMAQHG